MPSDAVQHVFAYGTLVDPRCLDQVLRAQGPLGQWAWHYNIRTGAVVDRYPVYAVHQHGMGPMAVLAVADATGQSYDDALGCQIISLHRWAVDQDPDWWHRGICRRLRRGPGYANQKTEQPRITEWTRHAAL